MTDREPPIVRPHHEPLAHDEPSPARSITDHKPIVPPPPREQLVHDEPSPARSITDHKPIVPPPHREQLAHDEPARSTVDHKPVVPPLHLEQLAHGELSPARSAAVRARLGPDADARVAEVLASDREILREHPPAQILAAVQRRVTPPPRRKLWLAAPALACAALAILVLRTGPDEHVPEATPDGVRVKGLEPRLVVHRQVGDAAVLLREPAAAGPRDVLQLSYVAAGAAHGVILSLDGNGLATLHFPAGIADSTALHQDGAVRLPQSYELDDAPRFERFVFITADVPLPVDRLLAAARELAVDPAHAPLAVPAGARQTSFLVEKPGR